MEGTLGCCWKGWKLKTTGSVADRERNHCQLPEDALA